MLFEFLNRVAPLIAISVLLTVLADEGSAASEMSLSLAISPAKSVISSGEPCILSVTISNISSSDLAIDLGSDSREAFWFDMFDESGIAVCASSRIMTPGLSRKGKWTIQSKDALNYHLVLNNWCTTLLPAGRFTIVGHLALPGLELRDSSIVTIKDPDEVQLKQIFSTLVATALSDDSSLEVRFFATQVLTSTDSPYAVESIRQLLRGSWIPTSNADPLESLYRIGTIDATREIANVASLPDENFIPFRTKAIHILRAIYRVTEDPAIRAICSPFVVPAEDKK